MIETHDHPYLGIVSIRRLEEVLGRKRDDIRRIADAAGRYYHPFDLRRIDRGGKWRHIDNPRGELKRYQLRIQERIFQDFNFPETMIGAIRGRSIRDNAKLHLRQPMIVTLDLRDCFPRINDGEVYRVFREVLGCSAEISSILTKLTTFQHRLPQGAPTSPTLANLSLLSLHDEMIALAKAYCLNCSFYVDDIIFSGEQARELIEPAIRLIQSYGHSVRRDKVKLMPNSAQQRVTGVVVNQNISVGKSRRRSIRNRVFELSHQKVIAAQTLQSILGEINWINWLNSSQGEAIMRSAESLLEIPAFEGSKMPKEVIRPCKSSRYHKRPSQV